MGQHNEDRFLDEIDAELRSVNKKLNKVIGDAEALLRQFNNEEQDMQDSQDKEIQADAEECGEIAKGKDGSPPTSTSHHEGAVQQVDSGH